jgi:two-component system, OmpR family, response regulator TctD
MRLLLVEDNPQLSDWLAKILRAHYAVDCVFDGGDADEALRLHEYALVILDLTLPELDGLQVLKRLRARGATTPVIILTANATLEGRVRGLDAGADDYLAKPFEITELEARIRAQLRRVHGNKNPVIEFGDLSYDTNRCVFELAGERLALTPREHRVLELLLRDAGKTLSKTRLTESIFELGEDATLKAIEVYIHRLRKKLEAGDVEIQTLRGLGYLLQRRVS